jgi:hypothetical protein
MRLKKQYRKEKFQLVPKSEIILEQKVKVLQRALA